MMARRFSKVLLAIIALLCAVLPVSAQEGYGGTGPFKMEFTHQNLHGDHPPALGPDNIHKGAPEGFYDPGKIEDTGIGRYVRVGHSHLLEHDG